MGLGAGGEEEQEQHKRRMIGTTADSAITIRLWSVVGCTGEPRYPVLVTLPLGSSSAKRVSTVSYINAADGTLTMYSVLPAATSISALLLRWPPFAPFLSSSVSCEKERCGNFITILWPGQVCWGQQRTVVERGEDVEGKNDDNNKRCRARRSRMDDGAKTMYGRGSDGGEGEGNTKNHRGGIGEEEEVDWKTEESNEEERPRGQGFNNGSLVTAMWKKSSEAARGGICPFD